MKSPSLTRIFFELLLDLAKKSNNLKIVVLSFNFYPNFIGRACFLFSTFFCRSISSLKHHE